MAENGKVLLVEMLLPLEGAASLESLMDLNMLVISTGRDRTEPEYREILGTAGLRITKIMPTPSPYSLIEGCGLLARKASRQNASGLGGHPLSTSRLWRTFVGKALLQALVSTWE